MQSNVCSYVLVRANQEKKKVILKNGWGSTELDILGQTRQSLYAVSCFDSGQSQLLEGL